MREKIGINQKDIEISTGDFIAKGPKSLETLRFLKNKKIVAIRGNHEDRFIRYKKHQDLQKLTGKKNPMVFKEKEKELFFSLNNDDFRFLNSTKYFIKIGLLTVVHAGITNKIFLKKATRSDFAKVMRVRFVDEKGEYLSLDEKDKICCFWSEVYDNHEGFIVYGHQPFLKPKIDRFSIGIDTGAVYGNYLSAVVFDIEEDVDISSYRFFFEKSKKAYVKKESLWLI